MIYVILTQVCLLLDLIDFFIGVSKFNQKYFLTNDLPDYISYGSVVILVVSTIYITLDVYYTIWAVSQYLKLPASYSRPVMLALFGVFTTL